MSTLERNQAKNTTSDLVKLADSGQIDAFSRLRISALSYSGGTASVRAVANWHEIR